MKKLTFLLSVVVWFLAMPMMAGVGDEFTLGLKMSHGLLAGSSINMDVNQEFELEVDEDFNDPYYDYYDAEEAD